jgi:hypothetical protein
MSRSSPLPLLLELEDELLLLLLLLLLLPRLSVLCLRPRRRMRGLSAAP